VDFTFSEEQNELRAVLRKFLAARCSETEVRGVMESPTGLDEAVWRELAGQVGLAGLAVPEAYGGAGTGFAELGIAAEEIGSALACIPFFSTVVLVSSALLLSGDEESCQRWLPRIVAGDLVATVAVAEGRREWNPEAIECVASAEMGWRLTGTKTYVLDGSAAGLVIVAARAGDSIGLFAVEQGAPGMAASANSTMDLTRRFASVRFDAAPAVPLELDSRHTLERLYGIALAMLAAEQVGGAQRCLDMAVSYAKQRYQFGRPIGSFQAIKHRCADDLILIEAARAASGYALWAAGEEDEEDFILAARMAKAVCSEAFFRAAADNIQVHGGIGFTWEHPAHLYFKRAKSSELWLGDPAVQRDQIGRMLELQSLS